MSVATKPSTVVSLSSTPTLVYLPPPQLPARRCSKHLQSAEDILSHRKARSGESTRDAICRELPRTIANGDGWGSFGRQKSRVGVWPGAGPGEKAVGSVCAPRGTKGLDGVSRSLKSRAYRECGLSFWRSSFMTACGYVVTVHTTD